jgi:AhpD family alkylhydroperoxidase
MELRIDARRHAREAQKAMYDLEKYLAESGLEHSLIHLMKMRVSQINGCAYCIDMHSKDARALGEPGPKPSPWSPRLTFQIPSTKKSANSSTKKKSSISRSW